MNRGDDHRKRRDSASVTLCLTCSDETITTPPASRRERSNRRVTYGGRRQEVFVPSNQAADQRKQVAAWRAVNKITCFQDLQRFDVDGPTLPAETSRPPITPRRGRARSKSNLGLNYRPHEGKLSPDLIASRGLWVSSYVSWPAGNPQRMKGRPKGHIRTPRKEEGCWGPPTGSAIPSGWSQLTFCNQSPVEALSGKNSL